MSLTDEERDAVVQYRIEKSMKSFQEAEKVSEISLWNIAANRLYYAVYYAATALLINNGHITRTHSGMITQINIHFVLPGILTKADGRLINKIFDLRQEADYDDFIDADENDIKEYFPQVKALIEKIVSLIK